MTCTQRFAAAMLAVGIASSGGVAQAQVALENGASVSISTSQTNYAGSTALYLGDASASTSEALITRMPLSLTYGSGTANISFTETSGLYDGGGWAPTSENYLIARPGGTVELAFSTTQQYFSTRWSSIDTSNQFSFYNGDQLVASTTGAQAAPDVAYGSASRYADFNFAELGYDRVVVSATAGSVEFGDLRFAGPAPEVAPIPLNAASMGGLMSFLMMLGMWGKGGARHMLRMAFASITPRRRVAGLA